MNHEGYILSLAAGWSIRYPFLDREDIAQELRIALISAEREYSPSRGASFKTWVYRRLQWCLYDILTRHNASWPVHRPTTKTEEALTVSPIKDAEYLPSRSELPAVETRLDLDRAAKRLRPRDYLILILRHGHELELAEVGRCVGMSFQAVSQRDHKSLKRMRRALR